MLVECIVVVTTLVFDELLVNAVAAMLEEDKVCGEVFLEVLEP